MLRSLNRTALRPSRRALIALAVLGLAALSFPTVRLVALLSGTSPVAKAAEQEKIALEAVAAFDAAVALAQAGDQQPAGEPEDGSREEVRRLGAPPEYLPQPSTIEEKILLTFGKPTTVDFNETALEDAINFIKDYHDINIWIDKSVLADQGVQLDTPVTLRLAGVRMESVLNLLIRPSQLDYIIEDDVLKITTAFHARETMFTFTYPVRDLYPNGKRVESEATGADEKNKKGSAGARTMGDLERAIRETIEPKSWDDAAKPNETQVQGTIAYVGESSSLVIRQSWPVHRKILKLLRDLREAKRLGQGAKKQPGAK